MSGSSENPPIELAQGAAENEGFADRLDFPTNPSAIYLEEASLYRPIATGDIFKGVPVPGSTPVEEAFGLTMVTSHPSAMRKGAHLERRARAAPVVVVDGLSRKKWTRGHHGCFPLPLLSAIAEANGHQLDDFAWGAHLELVAPIETAQLDVTHRVACLSPEGIVLLIQRLVYSDTRCAVKGNLIEQAIRPKLNELELLQDWNEDLVEPTVAGGTNLNDALQQAARNFEDSLNSITAQDGSSLRVLLDSGMRLGEVQRMLRREINRRRVIRD